MDFSTGLQTEGYKPNYNARSRARYLKRRKQVRIQRVLIASGILVFIIILSIAFGAIFTYAGSKSDTTRREKYYKSVMIQYGDTLSSIAEDNISVEYADTEQYIGEVMRINFLSDDTIQAGNYIVIPYYTQVL